MVDPATRVRRGRGSNEAGRGCNARPLINDAPSVDFAEWDDVIEALSAYCSDKSLAMCTGFRRPRRRLQDVKAKTSQALVERGREDRVAIVDEIAVVVFPWKCFARLLERLLSGGMFGDIEVKDPARADFFHDQYTEKVELGRHDGEEVGCEDVRCVVVQEGRPALTIVAVPAASWSRDHVLPYRPRSSVPPR